MTYEGMKGSGGEELARHLQLLVDLLQVHVPACSSRLEVVSHAHRWGYASQSAVFRVGWWRNVLLGNVARLDHTRLGELDLGPDGRGDEVAGRQLRDELGLVGGVDLRRGDLLLLDTRRLGARLGEPVQFIGQFVDGKLLKLDDAVLVLGEPLGELPAGGPLLRLHLAESLDEQHQWRAVVAVGLQLFEPLVQPGVVELIVGLVESGGIGEGGGVEAGEADRERLVEGEVGGLFELAVSYILEFLGREVGGLLLEDGLEVVGLLVGPAELRSHAHLPLGADEDVERADVAELVAARVEGVGSVDDGEDEIPELGLLEALALHAVAVEDLVAQQVGVVLEGERADAAAAAELRLLEPARDRQEEVLALAHLAHLLLPPLELRLVRQRHHHLHRSLVLLRGSAHHLQVAESRVVYHQRLRLRLRLRLALRRRWTHFTLNQKYGTQSQLDRAAARRGQRWTDMMRIGEGPILDLSCIIGSYNGEEETGQTGCPEFQERLHLIQKLARIYTALLRSRLPPLHAGLHPSKQSRQDGPERQQLETEHPGEQFEQRYQSPLQQAAQIEGLHPPQRDREAQQVQAQQQLYLPAGQNITARQLQGGQRAGKDQGHQPRPSPAGRLGQKDSGGELFYDDQAGDYCQDLRGAEAAGRPGDISLRGLWLQARCEGDFRLPLRNLQQDG